MTTVFSGNVIGIGSEVLSDGGGLTGPTLVSASSVGPNGVRLTFDREMLMDWEEPGTPGTLDVSSYTIRKLSDSSPLWVVAVVWIDDTHIDLVTDDQVVADYEVKALAGGAQDRWGNYITEQTDTFTGTARTGYQTPTTLRSFMSSLQGMQEESETDLYPDIAGPYLENQLPPPGSSGISASTNISFSLKDDDAGVDLSTVLVKIKIESGAWVLAYDGATDTFFAPYAGPGSSRVGTPSQYDFVIDPSPEIGQWTNVYVWIYAKDLAAIPNELDDSSWTFKTEDVTGPVIDSTFPTGTGASKDTDVSFSIKDVGGSGVDSSTLNVSVGGQSAIISGVFQSGWDGPSSAITPNAFNGYDVVIDKTTDYQSFVSISVSVTVDDLNGNPGSAGWSFQVEDYLGCLVTAVSPTPGQTNFPTTGNITLTIEDEDEVVAASILVEVDLGGGYEIAFSYEAFPQFKPGWDGPASDISELGGVYTIVIDPTTDFVVGSTIYIRVTAADPTGNPERLA